ncbi:DUF3325 domain-containing protein [Pseudoduganella lutea]|nr:DUF3325 domain-containing protein [Pseudoduganella lutea]
MADLLATFGALLMCCTGCALLALSQREHWSQAGGLLPFPSPRAVRRARVVASMLLAGALAPCIAWHGAGFGTLLWILLVAAGGKGIAFTLAWRPHWLAPLAFFMCDSV